MSNERLFIKLYQDEDVSVLLAELLKARGYTVVTAHEAGMLGKSDDEQLAYAVSQQKTFLTHNRVDCENLYSEYFQTGRHHYGIIIATQRDEYSLLKRLLIILNAVTSDEIENQIRYILGLRGNLKLLRHFCFSYATFGDA